MKIIPEIKATFGDTYFLGFTEKMKFDKATNKKTEELESYVCRLSSSELQGQIEVIVPPTVAVNEIKLTTIRSCVKTLESLVNTGDSKFY